MASYWPHADEDPSASAQEREFARIWRDMPKLVYSRTLQHAEWNASIVREVVPEDISLIQTHRFGNGVVLLHYAMDQAAVPPDANPKA